MKFSMLVLVAGPIAGPLLAVTLVAGCSNDQAGTGPSPTEPPSPVVVTPVPASPTRGSPAVPAHPNPNPERPKYPPPKVHPWRIGRVNPAVSQATIRTTVCVPGWTAKIRPPTSYTTKLKLTQLPKGADPSLYEEDHLLPLSLGGAPRDVHNLWPVLWSRAKLDDIEETKLHRAVCEGKLSLSMAQSRIAAIKRRP